MRLNDFDSVDELVEIGIIEFEKRAHAPSIRWIPSRQKIYSSQCIKYSRLLVDILEEISFDNIIKSKINPSQFIKSAQDYQLAARISKSNKDIIINNFLKIANIGMQLKRYYYWSFSEKAKHMNYICDQDYLSQIDQLNGLLRAFSETIYFDDHTVSGEFYGDITVRDNPVVVRAYNRLCPKDYLQCLEDFNIDTIETFCVYDDANMDFDCLGNITYTESKRPSIISATVQYVSTNGIIHCVDTSNDLKYLINTIEDQLKKVFMFFESMDFFTKQKTLLSSSFYAFKPLLDVMERSWVPTDEDVQLYISSIEQITEFDKEKESEAKSRDCSRIVDPRKDLY